MQCESAPILRSLALINAFHCFRLVDSLSKNRPFGTSSNYEEADFPLRWLQKDLHLVSVSAFETGVAMPLTNATKEIYRLAIRDGNGDRDFSAIYEYLARDQDAKPARTGYPEVS